VADVNLNIGSEGSHIEGSDIGVGDVAGENIVNVHARGKSQLEQITARVDRIERALSGELGARGLVWRLDNLADRQDEIWRELESIKQERKEASDKILAKLNERRYPEPMTIIFLAVATLALIIAVFLTLTLPRF